jgi:hypothetical protein
VSHTELNPLPNFPVVEPSVNFRESPMREMLSKSASLNLALLKASRAGPWYWPRVGCKRFSV